MSLHAHRGSLSNELWVTSGVHAMYNAVVDRLGQWAQVQSYTFSELIEMVTFIMKLNEALSKNLREISMFRDSRSGNTRCKE